MRNYIGHITVNRGEQIDQNPKHEALRMALLQKFGIENAEKEARNHLEEISGRRAATNNFLFLIDNDGRPPANISIEDIISQYNNINGQYKWVKALSDELRSTLIKLDAAQFAADNQNQLLQEQDKATTHGELYQHYTDGKQHLINKELQQYIRRALQKTSYSRSLQQQIKKDADDIRIIGIRQIETALRYIFADQMPDSSFLKMDKKMRYLLVKKEADWLVSMVAELESKRTHLKEMVMSAYVYLDGDA